MDQTSNEAAETQARADMEQEQRAPSAFNLFAEIDRENAALLMLNAANRATFDALWPIKREGS